MNRSRKLATPTLTLACMALAFALVTGCDERPSSRGSRSSTTSAQFVSPTGGVRTVSGNVAAVRSVSSVLNDLKKDAELADRLVREYTGTSNSTRVAARRQACDDATARCRKIIKIAKARAESHEFATTSGATELLGDYTAFAEGLLSQLSRIQ